MKKLGHVLVATSLMIASQSLAHESKGPNGGRVVDAGDYHLELVVTGSNVAVFVSDGDSKPLAPTRFKAVAILNAGGKAQRIALSPTEGKLVGNAENALPAGAKGVVQLTAPNGKVALGQFK